MYLAIYHFIAGLTGWGETSFFSSIQKVADYFDADYETVRRVFKQLIKEGWLRRDEIKRNHFWLVKHNEWEDSHKGQCVKRAAMVWEHESDPFVGKLYAIAEGKFKIYENQVIGIRKLATDEEILKLFNTEIRAAKERRKNGSWERTSPLACFWVVYKYLNEQRRDREQSKVKTESKPS